jgi:phosphate transport system protein
MKIAYDLERYGRYAWDVSFAHKRFAHLEKSAHPSDLMEKLVEEVMEMVHISIKALKNHDAKLAKTLAEIEEGVDEMYFQYFDQLTKGPALRRDVIINVLVARYLERIADHATYIGESVIYIATGEKLILR